MADGAPKIACPTCQKQFTFKPELAGRKVKCPKCGNSFTVTAPAAAAEEYDLAPEAPRPPATPRYVVEQAAPAAPEKRYPTAGQEAASVLATSARLGARSGVAGLVGGLAIGGAIMVVRRKPKVLLWGFFALAGLFFLCLGSGFIMHFFFRGGPREPVMPPPMPVQPAGMPGPGAPVTYDSLVARYGADHVFRIHVEASKYAARDMGVVGAFVRAQSNGNTTLAPRNGMIEAAFAANTDFDAFVTAAKAAAFWTVTATDPDQHTITATMNQP
jgi:uncharacterized Zn finger protein (UPF0148 family)